MARENKSKRGVYYEQNDYASLLQRVLVAVIDLLAIAAAAYLLSILWSLWADPPDLQTISEFGWLSAAFFSPNYFWLVTLAAYLYLAILKRTDVRTIGYRLLKLRIVDVKGNPPSVYKMSWRFALLVFGPFHLAIDLFWLGGDEHRQTLRDKFAGTYVIHADAVPAGEGDIVYERYNLLGLSLLFQEIKEER